MLTAYMVYTGLFDSAAHAATHFSIKRRDNTPLRPSAIRSVLVTHPPCFLAGTLADTYTRMQASGLHWSDRAWGGTAGARSEGGERWLPGAGGL